MLIELATTVIISSPVCSRYVIQVMIEVVRSRSYYACCK